MNKQATLLLVVLIIAVAFILITEHLRTKRLEARLDNNDSKLDHLLSDTDQVKLALAVMIRDEQAEDFDFSEIENRQPIGFKPNGLTEA